jgi:hypothetical protein
MSNQGFVVFGDVVEGNGKTIRENNLAKKHKLTVDTLVEVKFDKWHGDGCCEKIHGRYWIVDCGRDCDGTPLYSLSHMKLRTAEELVESMGRPRGSKGFELAVHMVGHWHGGFAEDDLTPVEVTTQIRRGYGALRWKDDFAT